MLRRQAHVGLLLLAFLLASPLAAALCDAACAGGSEPGMHHASATAAPEVPPKIAHAHHGQHAQLAVPAPVADLLGNSARCVSPRPNIAMATPSKPPATSASSYLPTGVSALSLPLPTAEVVQGRESSPPGSSPPIRFSLRI